SAIAGSPQKSAQVTAWDGRTAQCYQNMYGVMPYSQHGGSYPAAAQNATGNTGGGDLCLAVGTMMQGNNADGFSQNCNGFDAPSSDGDWPNASICNSGPVLEVWLR